jgi:hypothetical protein
MQYLNFLRINLKKIKILIILLFVTTTLYAFQMECRLESRPEKGKSLVCSVSAPEIRRRSILRSMDIGHRAEIEYRIKVYKKEKKLLFLFGDKLIKDVHYSYIGKKDPINGQFHIVSAKEGKKIYNSEKEFLENFYILDNLNIDLSGEKKGEYYVLGQVNLKVIKLVPPFNVFSFIIPGIVESSDWIKADRFRIE